jgi:hypothetical protein
LKESLSIFVSQEPRLDAQPLKPALKKPKDAQNGRGQHGSTPPQDKQQRYFNPNFTYTYIAQYFDLFANKTYC